MKKVCFCWIFLICWHVAFAAGLTLQFQLQGISGEPLKNATESLKALQTQLANTTTTATIQSFYLKAPNSIVKALEPFGYFHSKVSSQLKKKDHQIITIFSVKPGSVTRITKSTLKLIGPGSNNASLLKILHSAQKVLAVNQILNTINYEKIKDAFYATAENQGYLEGYFSDHLILVNRGKNTAVVTLTFDTGPRYYFGAVYYSKNPLAISFLNRYLPFQYGTPFSSQKLLTLQNNLSNTVYFNQVNVTYDIKHAKNYYIPVDVKLAAAKPQKYSMGLGYGTDTGIRGTLGWEWRRVTDTGHYFQTLMQVSEKQNNNFQARYIIPGKNPVTDYYAITAGIFTDKPGTDGDSYTTEQIGVNYVNIFDAWTRTLSLQMQHEDFTVDNIESSANTLIPSVSWEKIVAANRINVNNGYRLYVNFQGGAVLSATNASFLQSEFQGKYIHSFDGEKNRLILSTDIGATLVNNFAEMPLSQRFFAGGAQSVRGYAYQSLGPGRYLGVGGIEWQRQLFGKFYGAAFYNAGNAVPNLPFTFAQAAGIGALYRSPIGPIEITVAHPFNQPFQFNQHGLTVQFTMGPDL